MLGILIGVCAAASVSAAPQPRTYEVLYHAAVDPVQHDVAMTVKLSGEELPRKLSFRLDTSRHSGFRADGKLTQNNNTLIWEPSGTTASLHYRFKIDHQRDNGRYDALLTDDWAIFRGEDLVPSSSVTAPKVLRATAVLQFSLPKEWSVLTPYEKSAENTFRIENPDRRFQRPLGWLILGKIGSRNERIVGIETVIAAPVGDRARRQDMLAFLNWNLPQLAQIFPGFPKRLLIVSAGDPMWRGGLSGPASLFIHTSRPLISENRTSTILHELAHLALGIHGDEESDWIVEGLAEYYSVETLRRSGGIGEQRYEETMKKLARWGQRATTLFEQHSSGATTARAVCVFRDVDREIRAATENHKSLDDVARILAEERGEVTLRGLQEDARKVAGRKVQSLERAHLTGKA